MGVPASFPMGEPEQTRWCAAGIGFQRVPQFKSDIPDLLADNLPGFLSPGRVAAPAVGDLLAVFIS